MTDTTTQDRDAFEAWLSSGARALKKITLKQVFERDKNGQYVGQVIECCWVGWQAACAHREKQMQERMANLEADKERLDWIIANGIPSRKKEGPFFTRKNVDDCITEMAKTLEEIDKMRGKP